MGKYNKSSKNNIFKEEPEISVSEHTVEKNGRKMKMVIPEGKIGYGDTESHAQMAADLATKHSEDTKAGEKVYKRKMAGRMPVIQSFNITDPVTGQVIAQEFLFMKTEPSGLTRPLKIRVDVQSGKTTEVPV